MLSVGALVTVGLGYGITNLKFSTGQDSYLNKSDQVYKDSVAYQKLFGGEAMLTLVTMDKGHTVNELFTPENIAQWKAIEQKLHDSGAGRQHGHARSPRSEFNDALVTGPGRRSDPGRRRQDPARRASHARPIAEAQGGAQRGRGQDARRASPRSPSPSARSTTRSTSSSCSTTTRATSASRCSPTSPTTGTRRSSRGCRATRRSRTRARPSVFVQDAAKQAALRPRHDRHDRRAHAC